MRESLWMLGAAFVTLFIGAGLFRIILAIT